MSSTDDDFPPAGARSRRGGPEIERLDDAPRGMRFFSETVSPRDVATGHASGKRIHKPIVFTKEWDAASPKLFQALVTNEVLKSVLFEFVKTDAKGQEEVHFRITLANANVASMK